MKAQYTSLKGTLISAMIAMMVLLTINPVTAQDWYDTDWDYRCEVTIVNPGGTELTDFQVQITLDASFEFANANSDGSDIRITDTDGITLILFWIESWDETGQQADIWVKIPSVPTGGATVYLYYGNTAAISMSNGDTTFEFFDDFESSVTTEPGYYAFGPASTIMVHTQGWEYTAPHTLSVVEAPAGAAYTYYGYYGMQGCNGIGMAGSDDLLNWTKFPEFPSPEPNNPLFAGDGERWPSVYLDTISNTYYMVHTVDYCGTSYLVYRESTNGLSWTSPITLVPQVSGNSNQNACLFHDPNDGWYYLYWRRRIGSPPNWVLVRKAPTVAELVTADDIYLLNPSVSLAAPNMMYVDSTYFLSTEYNSGVWNTRIYSSPSPTGPFTELPGNPVLTDGCACLFQTPIGNTLYEYYCKQTGSVWTLDMRIVDLTAGRQIYGAIDEDKWTPSGGAWSVPSADQQDGTQGYVAQGTGVNPKDIQKSSFSGNDYILEGYAKQTYGRVWGFGFRASGAGGGNNYQLNVYEDLDGTQNMYLYNRTNFAGPYIWTTNLGQINMDTWYKIKVKVYGDNFDIYFNDELKTLTPISNSQWPTGSIALYLEGGYTAQFNDVRVRQYAATEPITAVENEETIKSLELKIYLEGPFNGVEMNTNLSELSIIPLSQPFNTSPWNYEGTEQLIEIPNADVVDWILIELRDAQDATSATSATGILKQAALLLSNGNIVGLDGFSPIRFFEPINQQLFVVVHHRNHLGIMSANGLIPLPNEVYAYDFTTASAQAHEYGLKELNSGVFGMYGGDVNSDGIIDELDTSSSWSLQAGFAGYLNGDIDLDGQVNNPDKNDMWFQNMDQVSHIPD